MPISHYPRFGERIAPQTLSDILDVRVCDSVRVGQLPSRIRFNQLDESMWERTTSQHCEDLAYALVEIVRLALPDLLECRADRTLPSLPFGVKLDELPLSVRTYNCLDNAYAGDLRVLRKATFENVLSLPNFGARSFVDLLVAIETCAANALPEATHFEGDERQAARLYVAQLIRCHPTLQRKLQASLDYQVSQYDNFIHKGIWASHARASFDAKVRNGLEVPATLPLWPSSQIALDFEKKAQNETVQEELFSDEAQTETADAQDDNRVLDHVVQVADVLNAVDDQSDAFRASSHRLAALLQSSFDAERASEELEKMRATLQLLVGITAICEELASSLQEGQRLSPQPDEKIRRLTQQIASMCESASIRRDDPRFGIYIIRLDSQSQNLEQALQQTVEHSCHPHLRDELQRSLHDLQEHLKNCSSMTVEEELHSLVRAVWQASSTELALHIFSFLHNISGLQVNLAHFLGSGTV